MRKSELKWQCRRGMRELDELLLRYVERRFDRAREEEKQAFRTVLSLSDPELVGYLLKRERPESTEIASVVEHILDRDSP